MPLPLLLVPLVPWLAGVFGKLALTGAGVGLAAISYEEVKRKFNDIGPVAIQDAFEKMGVQIDATHPIGDEAITAAINAAFLTDAGFQLESVFDREKIKRSLKNVAIKKVAESFGFTDVSSEVDLREKLQGWVGGEVVAQLTSEAGAVIDAANPSPHIQKVIATAQKKLDWNTPVDLSPQGAANRLAQSKYRHSHKRTWVLRGGA